jgi:spermidine synthase
MNRAGAVGWLAACSLAPVVACATAPTLTSTPKVLLDQRSPYQRVLVLDEGPLRVMRFGDLQGSEQSSIVREHPGALPVEYTRYALLGLAHHGAPRRLLMVGLGGGTFTTLVHRALPEIEIDAVEIDPVVVGAARAFFELREDARYRVHVADAVRWVGTAGDPYDVVLLDSYAGEGIPEALRTVTYFQSVARRLAPGGVVVINIAELEAEGADAVRAFRAVFTPFDCWEAPVDGNLVIFGAVGPRKFDAGIFARWLTAWDTRHITEFSLRELAARKTGSDCEKALPKDDVRGPGGSASPPGASR